MKVIGVPRGRLIVPSLPLTLRSTVGAAKALGTNTTKNKTLARNMENSKKYFLRKSGIPMVSLWYHEDGDKGREFFKKIIEN